MPGYALRGSCFSTLSEAQGADCVTSYPTQALNGGSIVTFSCTGVGASGLNIARSVDGGPPTALTLAPTYGDCNTQDVTSAVPSPDLAFAAFAWGFSGVIVCYCVAWGCGQVLSMLNVR